MLLCKAVRFERVEDDADELAFEAADRFASAFAFWLFAFEVGARAGWTRACPNNPCGLEGLRFGGAGGQFQRLLKDGFTALAYNSPGTPPASSAT